MHYRTPLFLLLCAPFAAACMQELDTGADREAKATLNKPPEPPREHPSIIPFVAEPPLVTPFDNTPTPNDDSCAATDLLAMDTLTAYCSYCHDGSRGGVPSGDFGGILDVDFLKSNNAIKPELKSFKYVVPGDPRNSAIYKRMADESMPLPPDATMAAAHNYRFPFTTSDKSLIYTWIKDCL